jgi:hypothetical protein
MLALKVQSSYILMMWGDSQCDAHGGASIGRRNWIQMHGCAPSYARRGVPTVLSPPLLGSPGAMVPQGYSQRTYICASLRLRNLPQERPLAFEPVVSAVA